MVWNTFFNHGKSYPLASTGLRVICPTITPTKGSNLLQNPGFETLGAGGTDVFANWAETANGSSVISDEGSIVHSGSHAAKFAVDGSNSLTQLVQGVLSSATWYEFSFWGRSDSVTPSIGMGNSYGYCVHPVSTTYTQYLGTQRATNVNCGILRSDGAASRSLYIDDVAAYALTFSSLHTLVGSKASVNGTYKCTPTVEAGTQAGMMIRYTDENNFVMMVLDRSYVNQIYLM